eukprot:6383675-Alexandrium_andersonii.AAC.1
MAVCNHKTQLYRRACMRRCALWTSRAGESSNWVSLSLRLPVGLSLSLPLCLPAALPLPVIAVDRVSGDPVA